MGTPSVQRTMLRTEQLVNAIGTVFMVSGAAHTGYLLSLPPALRHLATIRSAKFWRAAGLVTCMSVALVSWREESNLDHEYQKLQRQYEQLLSSGADSLHPLMT